MNKHRFVVAGVLLLLSTLLFGCETTGEAEQRNLVQPRSQLEPWQQQNPKQNVGTTIGLAYFAYLVGKAALAQ